MKIRILTLFPAMFDGVFGESILKRAIDKGLLEIRFYNIRDYAENKHHQVDDYPFGGGAGMLMMPQPLFSCFKQVYSDCGENAVSINFSPAGEPFTAKTAKELAKLDELILLCGHYEGIDQRVIERWIDREISLGDYVLTGGEIAAMAVIDAVARFIPGVLGSENSVTEESFSDGLLEYPQYTRPSVYEGMEVPAVLLSGNHAEINKWRHEQSVERTRKRRPDLLEQADKANEKFEKRLS